MPEEMNIEAAYALSERGGDAPEERRRWRELGEIFEVVILAIVAVATAWSGYQAARWDGRQALPYGEATRIRIEADEAATLSGQQRLLDVSTFNVDRGERPREGSSNGAPRHARPRIAMFDTRSCSRRCCS